MGMMLTGLVGAIQVLFIYGILAISAVKLFQIATELKEIKELLQGMKRLSGSDRIPILAPNPDAPYVPPSLDILDDPNL